MHPGGPAPANILSLAVISRQCPDQAVCAECTAVVLSLPAWRHELPFVLAAATQRLREHVCTLQVRKNGTVAWLRPDGKTQVTIEYKKDGGAMIPIRVHTILISTQHSPDVTNDKIHADLMEYVIKPVVPSKYLDDKTIFHLNPSGAHPACGPTVPALHACIAISPPQLRQLKRGAKLKSGYRLL